ncbi:MAG: MaoC/PaaZ C-terminal domain-containing protein [Sphingomonadaceae bacterium]
MAAVMDLTVGATARFGDYPVTREEVLEFAAKYDPQPFHLDDAAASAHPLFARLCASGWHVCAMVMRMTVEHQAPWQDRILGAAGVDELRWMRPVYPGDRLRCQTTILDLVHDKPRPGLVMATIETIAFNQDDVAVMRQVARPLFLATPPATGV